MLENPALFLRSELKCQTFCFQITSLRSFEPCTRLLFARSTSGRFHTFHTHIYLRASSRRAIKRGNLAEVKRFLDEGGDVETVGGRFHSTLLTEASRFRVVKVIDLLLERGAAANVSGGGFWTPLHYACDGPGRGSAAIAAAKVVATLIKNHAEVDATDFRGRTPLHLVCARGSAASALTLLEAGRHI